MKTTTLGIIAFICCAILVPIAGHASTSGLRTIQSMGCNTYNSICYLTISGASVGPPGCSSTSLRWDTISTNAREAFSQLTSAFLAGKQVAFEIDDSNCSPQAGYPTFKWYTVQG